MQMEREEDKVRIPTAEGLAWGEGSVGSEKNKTEIVSCMWGKW